MKKTSALNKAFSLIELLVVIAILGTLATFVIIRFSGAQSTAVDTKRQSELRQYQNALEIYSAKNNSLYPANLDTAALDLCAAPYNIASTCPQDPKVAQGWQDYWYNSSSGGLNYVLFAQLERDNSYFVLCSSGNVGKIDESLWIDPVDGACPL